MAVAMPGQAFASQVQHLLDRHGQHTVALIVDVLPNQVDTP
jgi:hypothetical protein